MRFRGLPLLKVVAISLGTLVVVGIAFAMPMVKGWFRSSEGDSAARVRRENLGKVSVTGTDTLTVPPEVIRALGISTEEVREAVQARPMPPMGGSLALDSNRLVRVHARFAGEIVDIGKVPDAGAVPTRFRSLRPGDKVHKGQLLVVLWSKDLGEKKSELVDSLSRLRLHLDNLERLRAGFRNGSVPERMLREAEQTVEGDRVAVSRAEKTLRSWQLTEAQIDAVKAEAERLHDNREPDKTSAENWARVEMKAPMDGTILERNAAIGDIVDTTNDLFKIADLSVLSVYAHAYEEDLASLQKLRRKVGTLHWSIRVAGSENAPLSGTIIRIGDIIDPNQHTALIVGEVDNSRGDLYAGQYIRALIEAPPTSGDVVVPTAALLEDGRDSVVFVQPDLHHSTFCQVPVQVAKRYHDVCYLRGLRPGERVVVSGAVELKAALEDLQSGVKPAE